MTPPFEITYMSEPFINGFDPVMFHGDHFADGQHRVMFQVTHSRHELHKTVDFKTFTQVDADWLPDEGVTGYDTFQSCVVLPDGTFVLYQNGGTEGTTDVWTGTAADIDAGTITRVGQLLAGEDDCGAFYEAATDLIHIYTEDYDNRYGSVSSSALSHYTTPADDLLNVTQHANAVDTNGDFGTGDPCIFETFGCYWMLTDFTVSHPTYWTALYRSDDLYTWDLIDPKFSKSTGVRAGDFEVLDMGDHLFATSEYTGEGGGDKGVGVWRIDKREAQSFRDRPVEVGGSRRSVTVGGSRRRVAAWPY